MTDAPEDRIAQLEAELKIQDAANDILTRRNAELEAELDFIKNAPGGLADELRLARQREQALIESGKLFEAEIAKLRAEAAAWKIEFSEDRDENIQLTKNCNALTSELAEYRDRLNDEENKLAELESRCYDQGGKFSNVFDECKLRGKERDALATIVEKQREALKEANRWVPDDFIAAGITQIIALDISQSAAILAKRDAEVLRKAAKVCSDHGTSIHGEGRYDSESFDCALTCLKQWQKN